MLAKGNLPERGTIAPNQQGTFLVEASAFNVSHYQIVQSHVKKKLKRCTVIFSLVNTCDES